MKILGIDICKDSAVCFLLDSPVPIQFNSFLQLQGLNYYKFYANRDGLEGLLALDFDIAVCEPTGVKYSMFWAKQIEKMGKSLFYVGHKNLKTYRIHLGLPGKDDQLDAFALAHYYLEYQHNPKRFVFAVTEEILELRLLVHRFQHLNRCQSPLINNLKQDLASQFPEQAKSRSRRESLFPNPGLFYRWLSGESKSKLYDKKYADSVGFGISDDVRLHAARICDLEREAYQIELKIKAIIDQESFACYRKVFDSFSFGFRIQAYLLAYIYPFDFFLYKGKPLIIHSRGRVSLKDRPTKKPISLRRFLKVCGVAPREESSGDKHSKKVIDGSSLLRTTFWQYLRATVELAKSRAPIPTVMKSYLKDPKRKGMPRRKRMANACTYLATLLFKALAKEFVG